MGRSPQVALLPDGRRLHLQDGPIDLVIEAFGARDAVAVAHAAAGERLTGLLDGLCGELTLLRTRVRPSTPVPEGVVARRMHAAVAPYAPAFVTPMAAVAGAVAEEVLESMVAAAPLSRAYVNNGGDIAFHLAAGERFSIGLVDRPDRPGLYGTAVVDSRDGVRGVATSGRRGRSFSFGIADAVTVLAATAAMADAAATMIANAVDLPGHPAVVRVPANQLSPDSDLEDRLVTRDVGPLAPTEVASALAVGAAYAEGLVDRGLIAAAALHLAGETVSIGRRFPPAESQLPLPPAVAKPRPAVPIGARIETTRGTVHA